MDSQSPPLPPNLVLSSMSTTAMFACRGIADPSLASAFLGQTWPLLHTILQRFKDQPRTVERCGRAIKTALQCAGKESAPLLPDVLQALAVQFAATRHCCMLYIASELLKIYGHDPAYTLPLGGPCIINQLV